MWAADFSTLEAKCGNYMAVGHAPNLGADPIHFLWQLRHNTGHFEGLLDDSRRMSSADPPLMSCFPLDLGPDRTDLAKGMGTRPSLLR
jgi:hypothetical protein